MTLSQATAFLRASSLHVGAAAAAAALRHDLVGGGHIDGRTFDEAFALARLTPGTNLLAMYALLGERLAGWRGAVSAVAMGTVIPGVVVVSLAALYARYADRPVAAGFMGGARAGALAVFVWAAVRLLWPQLMRQGGRGYGFTAACMALVFIWPIHPFVMLVAGAIVGATILGRDS